MFAAATEYTHARTYTHHSLRVISNVLQMYRRCATVRHVVECYATISLLYTKRARAAERHFAQSSLTAARHVWLHTRPSVLSSCGPREREIGLHPVRNYLGKREAAQRAEKRHAARPARPSGRRRRCWPLHTSTGQCLQQERENVVQRLAALGEHAVSDSRRRTFADHIVDC